MQDADAAAGRSRACSFDGDTRPGSCVTSGQDHRDIQKGPHDLIARRGFKDSLLAMARLMQTVRPSLALAEGQLALRWLLRNTIAARPYTSSFHDQTLQENRCRQGSVALTPAALLAGAVLGALLEENRKKPRSCSCDSEWWRDPAQCSDASTLWQRAWNADWDGRAPPTSSPSANPVKTTGQIRHLLFVRHGQYNLDDDEHGWFGLELSNIFVRNAKQGGCL